MPSGGSLGDRQRPQGRTARGGYASPVAAEIERKFLLDEVPDRLQGRSGRRVGQGDLSKAGGGGGRLRREEDRHQLTAKRGHGEVREEIEVDLDADQFEALWPLTDPRRLRKTGYLRSLGAR